MNCPLCGERTAIVASTSYKNGTERRQRECKACKRVFSTIEIREDMLDDYLETREKDFAGGTKKSLCWQCKRAYGGCSWSRDFIPVKGWEAEQTIVKTDKNMNSPEIESYKVKKCPLFIQDRKK